MDQVRRSKDFTFMQNGRWNFFLDIIFEVCMLHLPVYHSITKEGLRQSNSKTLDELSWLADQYLAASNQKLSSKEVIKRDSARAGVKDNCKNNNLLNIHVIIPCRRRFSVLVIISGISSHTNRRLFTLFSNQFYW